MFRHQFLGMMWCEWSSSCGTFRTGCQCSRMAMPSSLLISSRLVRWMCRAPLMSKLVLFFAWSNMLVSSHSIGCCCPQACSAMADFSVSLRLVAAQCAPLCRSRGLYLSPLYIHDRNCKGSGAQFPTSSPAGLGL